MEEGRKEGVMEDDKRAPTDGSDGDERVSAAVIKPAREGREVSLVRGQAGRQAGREGHFISPSLFLPSPLSQSHSARAQGSVIRFVQWADGVPPLPKCSCPLVLLHRCPCTHRGQPDLRWPNRPHPPICSCPSCHGPRWPWSPLLVPGMDAHSPPRTTIVARPNKVPWS